MPDTTLPRPLRATDVLSVLIIAPVVAWVWIWCVEPVDISRVWLIGLSLAGAVTFGVTTYVWAAEHGWTRWSSRILLGGAAGLGPPVTVLLAGALGLVSRVGVADTLQLFEQGAPIPGYGLVPWPAFVSFAAQCSGVDAVSGAIQWAIVRSRGDRR